VVTWFTAGREQSGWRERDVKKMNDVRPNSGDSTKKSNNNLTELYQH